MNIHKLFLLMLAVVTISAGTICRVEAQSKVVRKTVNKMVAPQITPLPPPRIDGTLEVQAIPPRPEIADTTPIPTKSRGLFGWNREADLGLHYLSGQGSLLGVRGDLVFADPWNLGEKIGLAEDSFVYKAGLGFASGSDASGASLTTLPLYASTLVYLREGSFFGLDPYLGAGVSLNLLGTNSTSGGWGGQVLGGILADFGSPAGKTEIGLGLGNYNVGSNQNANGVFFSVTQPLVL